MIKFDHYTHKMTQNNSTQNEGIERYIAYARSSLIPFGKTMINSEKSIARYLAYSSDVGESFRPIVNKNIVRSFYALSWGYVAQDVYNYGFNSYDQGKRDCELYKDVSKRILYQSFASMILPAFTIHQTVHYTGKLFLHAKNNNIIKNFNVIRWGPTCMGMCVVPFLPYMFDEPVEKILHYVF
jgi:mitochondrial fission process protein 1